jgi:hypothetical protein
MAAIAMITGEVLRMLNRKQCGSIHALIKMEFRISDK